MRAAIYARYSSDHQREASIEDQLRICKERIAREGWDLVEIFQDKALSGASLLRPGYQAMLTGAVGRRFDVVVAEALDRLSRDQEDVAGLFKRLRFAGIQIVTLAEGEISELHVGLKGTMNALFLKDLAAKTHRGMTGRVQDGKSGGGLCYGYDVARTLDERGERIKGDRAINPAQAAIVQRIFGMFATGSSPIAIAKALNAEGLPGPEGRAWRDTTIRGHALRGTGILRNELYVGRLIWNRLRYVRDPQSGKRISRVNPETDWVRHNVPDLRIIDEATWAEAQHRLQVMRSESGADQPDRNRFWERRRAVNLLTQKMFCGSCGGQMSNIGQDYLACSAARRQGVCANTNSIKRGVIEGLVLDALRNQLMAPELVAEFVKSFTVEWNRLIAESAFDTDAAERELASVDRKLAGLIDALAEGFRSPGLQSKLDALEARRATLQQLLAAPVAATPRLHPNLAAIYQARVARLQEALQADPDGREALEAVRGLIDRVIITPGAEGCGHEIELIGEIAAMIGLASGAERKKAGTVVPAGHDLFVRSVKVVAGACNHLDLLAIVSVVPKLGQKVQVGVN
jgi:DNA invertase Pin-like site-specific DNA recombinase